MTTSISDSLTMQQQATICGICVELRTRKCSDEDITTIKNNLTSLYHSCEDHTASAPLEDK